MSCPDITVTASHGPGHCDHFLAGAQGRPAFSGAYTRKSQLMAFHCQYTTLTISQQQTLLAEFLQQRLDLVVLELDDLLLTFVSSDL